MQLHEEFGLLYSPTDLVTFLACRHASYLDRLSLKELLEKTGDSRTNQLLQKMGLEHEKAYLQSLRAEGRSVAEIPGGPDLLRRAALTREAMECGVDVIYQGVFLAPPWRGDADFLMKCDRPSRFGAHGYEVVDTKLARTGEPKHVIQLCVYSDMLADVQGVRSEGMSLRLGTGESCRFLLDDFFHYYRHARQGFEQFQLEQPASTMPTPEPCGYCGFCRWSDRCKAQWEAEDHLSRIANIQRAQVARLEAAGIGSLAALASTAPELQVPGLAPALFHRLRAQAILQHHKAQTGQDRYELLPASAGKGFARIPLPDEGDLFFDMEGDPLYPGGLEYLFGLYYREDGQERFLPFWAHDHAGEKEAFRQFMAFLADHLARYPRAHIYHYNHYETTALKRLSCRHACCEEQLDDLLKRGVFVDLYVVVRESIRTSESGYSIKNLETFYMEKRANAVANAAESIVVYNEWRETHEAALLQDIAAYNEVDCHSTLLLRDWLLSLRPEKQAPASPAEEGAGTGEELPLPRRDEDVEHEVMLEQLAGIEGESALVGERLSHLLEFHRREAKPQWWGLYDRQTRYDDELLDDAECLVGLQQVGDAELERNSLVYSYRFPPQDCKLKVGSRPLEVATLRGVGTIAELDERARLIRLKQGRKQPPLPRYLSLGPTVPVDGKPLRGALYRYAARLLTEPDRPCVATEILARNRPKIRGRKPGERLVASADILGETLRAVEGLEDSYLFIQGPPGAGKTYTCSHVIVALIRQGKKVGITSNSHKAIHNLLEKIEAVAMEQGVIFRGIKKASSSSAESVYNSAFTISVQKTEQIDLTANLFASTAWGFVHSHFEGQLDYLFIDEAGQVATANVIGMAGATRNIILVGDQMQLGQPVQGVHPGEAGLSVLEFLLGDEATIPPDRGIFLGQTRRMRPSICRFISEAFYEGRLSAHESTLQRHLALQGGVLPDEGIVVIPACHKGCSQKSEMEGEMVKRRYNALLGQAFTDRDGTVRPLTVEDIMVVTPYNVQVNFLRSLLPETARIGTVDKFQGQEAPVVLLSMVTSSAEELPRNIEFLYSRNRLNVAISRAQCLAVVIASPALLDIPCHTVEQMRLVNTLCWLDDYARPAAS